MEIEDVTNEKQNKILDKAPIQQIIRVETLKSVHSYWLISGDCNRTEWEQVQERLIDFFGSDPTIKDASRVMRVPRFNYVTYDPEIKKYSHERMIDTVVFEPSRRFTVEQMLENFPAKEITKETKTKQKPEKKEGQTNPLKIRVPKCNNEFNTFEERQAELIRRVVKHSTTTLNDNGIF